jgi:hypothetical protein
LSEGAKTARRAGETGLRARWATRQPCGRLEGVGCRERREIGRGRRTRATWLYVAGTLGVLEKPLTTALENGFATGLAT